MHSQPLSIRSLVYSGKGGCDSDGSKKKSEGLPLNNLGLGIGGSDGLSFVIKREKEFLFTAAQLQELHLQVAVFNYIISGLTVPFYLVLRIWKSVASSLGIAEGGICEEFPGLVGFIPYRSMMDPEPWRCRRTDGKKWRCYRNVVPDQKYCERHMHRGCQRSRKHVEATEAIQKSSNTSITSDNLRLSVVSTSLDLTIHSSSVSKRVPATVEVGSHSFYRNRNSEGNGNNFVHVSGASNSLLKDLTCKNANRHDNNCTGGKDFSFNNFRASKIDWLKTGNKNYFDASVVPGFGLSPKSVLQSGFGIGCSSLSCENETVAETEAEPLRCRRTDGKKWRCSRDVVPDKKYCENHLHRGAKKTKVDSKLVSGAPVCFSTRVVGVSNSIHKKVENRVNLDTNLSISIASSPQQQMSDSDSSSSSDATTVTDENVCGHILTLSP